MGEGANPAMGKPSLHLFSFPEKPFDFKEKLVCMWPRQWIPSHVEHRITRNKLLLRSVFIFSFCSCANKSQLLCAARITATFVAQVTKICVDVLTVDSG